jgi:hypothetical protein
MPAVAPASSAVAFAPVSAPPTTGSGTFNFDDFGEFDEEGFGLPLSTMHDSSAPAPAPVPIPTAQFTVPMYTPVMHASSQQQQQQQQQMMMPAHNNNHHHHHQMMMSAHLPATGIRATTAPVAGTTAQGGSTSTPTGTSPFQSGFHSDSPAQQSLSASLDPFSSPVRSLSTSPAISSPQRPQGAPLDFDHFDSAFSSLSVQSPHPPSPQQAPVPQSPQRAGALHAPVPSSPFARGPSPLMVPATVTALAAPTAVAPTPISHPGHRRSFSASFPTEQAHHQFFAQQPQPQQRATTAALRHSGGVAMLHQPPTQQPPAQHLHTAHPHLGHRRAASTQPMQFYQQPAQQQQCFTMAAAAQPPPHPQSTSVAQEPIMSSQVDPFAGLKW